MAEDNLERVRSELDVLRKITGIEYPYERLDVRIGYAVGFASAIPLIAGVFGVQSRHLLLASAFPFLLAVVAGVAWNYVRCHPRNECPAQKRRSHRAGTPVMLVVAVVLFGFQRWAIALDTPAGVANGAVMVFLGLLLVIGGLYERFERHNIPMGVLAIVGGLLWPLCDFHQFWVVIWALTGVGALTGTAILHWQMLRLTNRTRLQNGTH